MCFLRAKKIWIYSWVTVLRFWFKEKRRGYVPCLMLIWLKRLSCVLSYLKNKDICCSSVHQKSQSSDLWWWLLDALLCYLQIWKLWIVVFLFSFQLFNYFLESELVYLRFKSINPQKVKKDQTFEMGKWLVNWTSKNELVEFGFVDKSMGSYLFNDRYGMEVDDLKRNLYPILKGKS